jgi:hypothetical protein
MEHYRSSAASRFFRNLGRQINRNKNIKKIKNFGISTGKKLGINKSVVRGANAIGNLFKKPSSRSRPRPPPPPPPLIPPKINSSYFPENFTNERLYSHTFCDNISYFDNIPTTGTNNNIITKPFFIFDNNSNPYKTVSSGIDNCIKQCSDDIICGSYTFNKTNNTCSLFNSYPKTIKTDWNSFSGYKKNPNFNFDSLNTNQKNVIRNDCLNSILRNENISNKDFSSCLKPINNNGNNSKIIFDPDCVFNKLGKGKIVNERNNINVDSLSTSIQDKNISKYVNDYQGYLKTQINLVNINDSKNSSNVELNHELDNNYDYYKDNIGKNKFNDFIETFDNINNNNNNNNNKKLIYILIIFLFICIIFYFITKKK